MNAPDENVPVPPALVLVIEDDPVQQLMASASLERAGLRVICAANGVSGLDAARQSRPDLIVCDVVMPGINGFQLLAAVRQEPGLADIPVIMLTAMAERAHVRMGMNSGADDYLPKPFKPAELCEAVNALLAKRTARRSQAAGQAKEQVLEALDWQKNNLAQQYEMRLVKELNSRWADVDKHNEEIAYADCTVLAVNLFSALLARLAPGADAAAAVRQGFQNARDTLYLFGARHLIPQGQDLLAVFVAELPADGAAVRARALRAALGLITGPHRAAGENRVIALHNGPATLLHVTDPLHGDASTILSGETPRIATGLMNFGQESGWHIVCSAQVLTGLESVAVTGRRQTRSDPAAFPLEAVELLSLT